ncbi:HAMP domain-containing sensor histidine kinase [Actinoplanes sp. NPDC026619]|uniref:sensor histidine kinase n=1 Tax=Actinoplanes sp. NPDC026619 TaxID=3155798 RepID=UPI0033F648BE
MKDERVGRLPKLASVRVRAAFAAALAAALCFGGGALWLRHVIYTSRMAASMETAQMQARGIAATYDTSEARASADIGALAKKQLEQGWGALGAGMQFPYYTESYAVVDGNGKLLLAQDRLAYYVRESGLAFPSEPPEMTEGWTGQIRVFLQPALSGERGHKLDGREVTLAARNIGDTGRETATVYVLATPLPAENAVNAVDRWLFPGLPAAVLLVAVVAWWAAGRALRPVERMRAELARITAADMSRRVPQPHTGDEIARLAVTMNETLDRLADAAERQRRFVADAAHELRSPLAGLRNTVEVAIAHGDAVDLDTLDATTERLQRLTDDLLLLARLEPTAPASGKAIDMAAVAEELVGERGYRVPPDERFVVVAGEPALVLGREDELARLLGNLLDNASRYARDRITVTVAKPEPGIVRVEVRDDGPGIQAAERERIFERFARVDEARDRGHGGAGLGLAIARDIAVRHGGTLFAADSTGGATLVAEFPEHLGPGEVFLTGPAG